MINIKSVVGACVFALVLTEVTSWTIDLPLARKFFFERSQHKHGDANTIYFNRRADLHPYNNIEGNSQHNTPHRDLDHENYAHEYGYLSYMEKKVHGIFSKGNIYLEGLRKAMERYSEQLENCTRLERSRLPTNRTWVPEPQTPQRLSPVEARVTSCEKVTRESETVRRLASLVVWAIKELQDIAYAKDYDKKTNESEEYVLLLQLAWALDELARITGFEPDASEFATEATPAPTPSTTPITYFNLPIPNDGPTNANCLKEKSSVPATIRCAVPVPEIVLQFLNISNSSSIANNSQAQDIMRMLTTYNNSSASTGRQPFGNMSLDETRRQMLGCLSGVAGDPNACMGFAAFMQFLNNNGQLQNFEPRQSRETDMSDLEILQEAEQNPVIPLKKPRNKRSTNDPLEEFAVYFGKYKVWTNSNPQTVGEKSGSFEVKNDLTAVKTVRKRSIAKPGIKIRVPEDPMQDLSSYAKHRPNVHYVKDTTQANEIKSYLEKIHHKDIGTAKDHVRKLNQLIKSVHKRSVYYRKLHSPRVPENPMQDISYYVKNKPGTNIRPDLANAALVRLGLQQIFDRGNIAIVHRYGSNYIPGVQPIMAGAVESFADI